MILDFRFIVLIGVAFSLGIYCFVKKLRVELLGSIILLIGAVIGYINGIFFDSIVLQTLFFSIFYAGILILTHPSYKKSSEVKQKEFKVVLVLLGCFLILLPLVFTILAYYLHKV